MNEAARIIAEFWAERLSPAYTSQHPIIVGWRKELQWLRKSLEADTLPDWLVAMVIERWWREKTDEWTTK